MRRRDTNGTIGRRALGWGMPFLIAGALAAPAAPGGGPSSGQAIYRQRCAACHGAQGEGTRAYPKALAGSQSLDQLTRFVARSMPPGPRPVGGRDARAVADYLHRAFYSPLARERSRPPRIALSRLTVGQFRNAVADLVGSFRAPAPAASERGLRAAYFKARRFRDSERVLQRIDPEVRFDFGKTGPTGGEFDPHQFSIRWEGGVVAPDTGEYEFIVHSDQAIRLWVNDPRTPRIDAWVKSGSGTEFRAPLYLIGGRVYPLRLEFSKSTQGVDDTEKKKGVPPAPASVALAWKRPRQAEETIPARCLVPAEYPEVAVVSAPFPPDDRSVGYERGTSVSRTWDDATTAAALETADYLVPRLRELSGVPDEAKDREARLRSFCRAFVQRAFRRPLTDELARLYVERPFQTAPDLETAVKRVVLLTLKSPRFLYRELSGSRADAYDTASRLSFALWDSLPDEALWQAAAAGQLATPAQIAAQAERMARDPRAGTKLRAFFLQWLKVEPSPDLVKDAKRFPDFTPAAAADLRTSLELTLESVLQDERADFRELLLADRLYLNGRLARLYGMDLPAEAPFQKVALDPDERAGVLTHPYLLASFAYLQASSPIHRGVLIARNLLGRTLAPPPAAFAPLAPSLHPDLTTRERVALQTRPAACASCHSLINPLGYPLERFDAIGRLRTRENGKPIDSRGSYTTRVGQKVAFAGPRDLARYLANSDETHAALVEKLFQHLVKQPVRAYGGETLPRLRRTFAESRYNVRKLMIEIAAQTASPGRMERG